MTGKRLLFVNHNMAMGGIETMLLDMIRLLAAEGWQVEVAVFERGGSLEAALARLNIPVHDLAKHEGFDAGLAFRLRKLIRQRGIGVVHSHNFSPWLYTCMAACLCTSVTHVHTEHSGVDASPRRYAMERWLARFTDHVVAVSKHVHELMTGPIGIPAGRVRLIYNGVHTRRFHPDADLRAGARAALGADHSTVLVGIVARLVPVKNHTHLLAAFRQVANQGRHIRLVIVGNGVLRQTLEAQSAELSLEQHVTFLGERRDTEALFNAFDIYVLSSTSEGMNLTLLEAMSTGLPAVATDVGGNGEIVLDGKTGYLVPVDDAGGMARSVLELAADASLRARFGAAAREATISRFGEDAMIAAYIALYKASTARK